MSQKERQISNVLDHDPGAYVFEGAEVKSTYCNSCMYIIVGQDRVEFAVMLQPRENTAVGMYRAHTVLHWPFQT